MREQITIHNFANTAPVINWLKLNNSGEKLLTLVSSINTPAVGAAIVIQQYTAKENDEISLQIGDLISIIEMPESSKSIWWRGKRGFEVGFFPSSCVEVIGSNILNPTNLKQLIKQHAGNLNFKQSNNENENLLVYLLKCKQLAEDDKLSNLNKTKEYNQIENNSKEDNFNNLNNQNSNYRNDKKSLIECQTNSLNSMNNKQHNTTPKINLREIRSISPIQNTDHHTPQTNYSSTQQRNLFLKSSTKDNQKILTNNSIATNSSSSGSSVFQRRNRISSTLPKSLNSTINSKSVQEKPICVNLFNQINVSFDLSSTGNQTSSQQQSFNQQQLNNSSINRTNDSTMGNNNKRGNKLSSFLRSIINRNNSNQENQYDKRSNNAIKRNDKSNILINLRKNKKILIKNTVFGCELNDYLNRTGRKIPLVLKSCCDFLENNGIIHGIYRLSGVNSNIQRLIKCFNNDEEPDFNDDIFLQDVHCVSSLLKLYFRELPNPLLTFELYENFVKAINPFYDPNAISTTPPEELPEKTKLANLIKVLKLLPLNHYIALEYLVRHLNKIASYSDQTGMTIKNLGIVWSPNLLRSKELETQGILIYLTVPHVNSGIGALQCISVQAILTEYLIRFADELFTEESRPFNYFDDQENENDINDSLFLNKNKLSFNQSNYSSTSNQNNSNQFNFRKDLNNKQADENHFQSNDNQLSDNSMDENKFPIKQDDNLITLQEAQSRWKKKSKLLDEDKTIDQLISSNFNIEDDQDEINRRNENSNNYITGLSCLSFNNQTNNNQENEENDKNKYNSQKKRFGNLDGEQVFTGTRKRFGNLDLVDESETYKESKSFVSKRRNLFEQGSFNRLDNEDDILKSNKFRDRYRYKNFDEHSDENLSKSNNSLKFIGKEEDHEPIKRYHTILNPKDFNKNRIAHTSTPKELNSNIFNRQPQSKWKT